MARPHFYNCLTSCHRATPDRIKSDDFRQADTCPCLLAVADTKGHGRNLGIHRIWDMRSSKIIS